MIPHFCPHCFALGVAWVLNNFKALRFALLKR